MRRRVHRVQFAESRVCTYSALDLCWRYFSGIWSKSWVPMESYETVIQIPTSNLYGTNSFLNPDTIIIICTNPSIRYQILVFRHRCDNIVAFSLYVFSHSSL